MKKVNHQHQGRRREGELTPLQWAFVEHYMLTRSASKAAELAGMADPRRRGWITMQVQAVVDEINRRTEELKRRNAHLEDQVLQELATVAFSNIADFVNFSDGALVVKSLDDIPDEARAVIKKVTLSPGKYGDKIQLELHDKIKANELLGKFLEMWGDKNLNPAGPPVAQPICVVTGIDRQPGEVAEEWEDL